MTPSLTDPPTPQRFFSFPARSLRPSSSRGTPETVVTALPRRPLVSRRTFTRPPARAASRARTLSGSRALRRSPSVLDQTTLVSPRRGIAAQGSAGPRPGPAPRRRSGAGGTARLPSEAPHRKRPPHGSRHEGDGGRTRARPRRRQRDPAARARRLADPGWSGVRERGPLGA